MKTILLMLLISLPAIAAPREMSDAEMDAVHAGESPALAADEPVATTTIFDYSQHTVTLADQAQQNLTSLVNIVAVNSAVQVMLNINVAIDSNVGSVTQGNNGSQQ